MQQLMKSMREATLSSGMLDNEGTKLGNEMLDSQYAAKMTGLPGGLTDAIARQLERQMGAGAAAAPAAPRGPPRAALRPRRQRARRCRRSRSTSCSSTASAARAAEAQSGIPAAFMIGQAAHESGWGRQEIRNADGSSASNLFGIKAGAGWNGPVAEITTTEYVDGVAQKVTAKFRAYASLRGIVPRLRPDAEGEPALRRGRRPGRASAASAASAAGFAQGLQRAGYATDPAYADKLARVINTTMRVQRA